MTVSAEDIMHEAAVLSELEGRVEDIIDQDLPFDRVESFHAEVSMSWLVPSRDEQRATWANTGGDFYVQRIRYAAWLASDASATDNHFLGFRLVDNGRMMSDTGDSATQEEIFDFMWNMRRRTTGAYYGIPTGGTGYLARQTLGNMERNEPRKFRRPWLLPMGDAAIFNLLPTAYASQYANMTSARCTVLFMLDGFRTGSR